MSKALEAEMRADEARLEALGNVIGAIGPLAKPRRPAPRMVDVDRFYLPDGLELYVESDGQRVELTLGQDDADSLTAYMDSDRAVRLAEALLRNLGHGADPTVAREVVRARSLLRSVLDEHELEPCDG